MCSLLREDIEIGRIFDACIDIRRYPIPTEQFCFNGFFPESSNATRIAYHLDSVRWF